VENIRKYTKIFKNPHPLAQKKTYILQSITW
jgi:hypothetical protein